MSQGKSHMMNEVGDQTREEIDNLKASFSKLREEMMDTMNNVSNKTGRMAEKAWNASSDAAQKGMEAVRDQTGKAVDYTRSTVTHYPLSSLVVGAAVGLLVGAWLIRDRD